MRKRGSNVREPWVSVQDVAQHLGVAKDTVYRWIESGRLPAHKVGRLWKFKLGLVDEWVEAGNADAPGSESRSRRRG
jgi:excisionase family DNA binding protein